MRLTHLKRTFILVSLSFLLCFCGGSRTIPPYTPPVLDWIRPLTPDEIAKIQAHRAANQDLVRRCVSSGNRSGVVKVDYESLSVCKIGGRPQGGDVHYRVSPASDGLANIRLHLGVAAGNSSVQREAEMIGVVSECIPTVKEYFERSGIHLDLTLRRYLSTMWLDDFDEAIILNDGSPTDLYPFSSHVWYVTNGAKVDGKIDPGYCEVISHEIGHILGGPDEYLDKNCPDRPFVSQEIFPWSIMASHSGLDRTDFYPRHIKDMIRPLCEDLATAEGWPKQETYSYQWM